MESIFKGLYTDEEIIAKKMKDEERSTYWLARKMNLNQSHVYRVIFGVDKNKRPLTTEFKNQLKEIWPDLDLT